jgi:hypothetical protein
VYAMSIISSKMESSSPLGTKSKLTRSLNVMGSTILLVILTDGMDWRRVKWANYFELVVYLGSLSL